MTSVYEPIVNSVTGNIYIGNLVINGSTDKVVGRSIGNNMTFVAVDESNNLVYAKKIGISNGDVGDF